MKVNPNYEEAVDMGPLVDGVYACEILSVEGKVSQNGNRYLNWKLEVHPLHRIVYYTTMVEGKASGMLKHFIRCVVDPNYEEGIFETAPFIGKMVQMTLAVEEFDSNGRTGKGFKVKEVHKPPTVVDGGDDQQF